jgi:hypothetical protein
MDISQGIHYRGVFNTIEQESMWLARIEAGDHGKISSNSGRCQLACVPLTYQTV